MRELTADMFITLDGFTADAEGSQDWMRSEAGPEFHLFVQQVLSEPQLLIMGRRTYQIMASSWPQSSEPPAAAMNGLPKLVFSKTLRPPLTWHNSRLASAGVEVEISTLKQQEGDPLRTIGSVSLVKSLVAHGLVDKLRLTVFPAVLGNAGTKPMFDGWDRRTLRLTSSRVLDSTVIVVELQPAPQSTGLRPFIQSGVSS